MRNRSALVLGLSAAACAFALAGEREAQACGGCFHPPTQVASDITDERMLLAVSQQQSTLYDQIRYQGSPTSFAWVLPIKGTVDVGLSADVLFDSMDVLTQTTIIPPQQNCPPPPSDCAQAFGQNAAPSAGAGGGSASDNGGVTVTKQQNVGPYATVQLHATDSSALEKWLSDNGYTIPADVQPTVNQYVTEGFDFLAMKLLPNQGVQAMRPVRVTSQGANLSLPLRMAAVGTGVSVGITIWVVSDGRYEPQNFPFFHIEDKDLVWDWSTNASNYTTLRATNAQMLMGKGWEMESSLDLAEQTIRNVILSGGQYYGGPNGGGGGGPAGAPSNASDDYLPVPADADAGADGGVAQTADDVRNLDITTLFAGQAGPNVRVTRMRSDISHAAMTTDFVLRASADQSELSNVRTVTNQVNLTCPVYDNCNVVGYAPYDPSSGQFTGSPTSGNGGSSSHTGGCATTTNNNTNDLRLAGACGALGIVGLVISRRRRKAARLRK
jgi:hypothetical protein